MKFLTFVMTIAVSAILTLLSVGAQESTPAPGSLAARSLPAADSFGDGWTVSPASGVSNLTTDVFSEGAVGYYGGQDGARALVMVLITTDARITIRQGWIEASSRFDTYRYGLTTDSVREQELTTIPPPPGCEEVKRSEGVDGFGFATAITLCAGADNQIVLSIVSGGEAATLRYEAADQLATAAIQRGAE